MSVLENLIKIKTIRLNSVDIMSFQTTFGTYVIAEVQIPNLKNRLGIPRTSIIVSVSAAQSPGYVETVTYNYNDDTAYVGNIVNIGNPRWVEINVSYIIS